MPVPPPISAIGAVAGLLQPVQHHDLDQRAGMQARRRRVEADIGGHRFLGEQLVEAGLIRDLVDEAALVQSVRRKSDLKADMVLFPETPPATWHGRGKCDRARLASRHVESQGSAAINGVMSAIGLMSGTSMDGIDVALLRTDGADLVERGPSLFVPYDAAFRGRIEAALETAKADRASARNGRATLPSWSANSRCAMPRRSRHSCERCAGAWRKTRRHRLSRPDRPAPAADRADGATRRRRRCWRRRPGIAVVYDMRANDMKHGGQGAPLVPAYHAALARSLPAPYAAATDRLRQYRRHLQHHLCAAKTAIRSPSTRGPGNTLIDQWVTREGGVPFDADGAIASEGGVVALSRGTLSRQSVLRQSRSEIARPQRFHARTRRRGWSLPTARAHLPPFRPRRS